MSHFTWSWLPGALGCEGYRVSLLLAQVSPPHSRGGLGSQDFVLHHPHLYPGHDLGEAVVLPRLGTLVWGAESERLGCPTALIQHPTLPGSPAKGDLFGGRCCSMRGGHGLGPGLKRSKDKVPGTRGQESALLPYARLSLGQVLRAASSQILRGRVGLRNKRQLWLV